MIQQHKTTYRTTINAPVEKVWDALTNPSIVRQYFFGTMLETDWKVGSPLSFSGEWEGKPYKDKGEVLSYQPNKKLEYSYLSNWSGMEDKPENYLIVGYEVKSIPGGTELIVTQTNYDAEKAAHSEQNWSMVIDGMRKLVE